jgi:hypothetical protein
MACATTPRSIRRTIGSGDFAEARELLDRAGAGAVPSESINPRLAEVRLQFEREVTNAYLERSSKLEHRHELQSAIDVVEEGVRLCPWSRTLSNKVGLLRERLEAVEHVARKWGHVRFSSDSALGTLRHFVRDLGDIGQDFRTSELLTRRYTSATKHLLTYWSERLADRPRLVDAALLEELQQDLKASFLGHLASSTPFLGARALTTISLTRESPLTPEMRNALTEAERALSTRPSAIALSDPGLSLYRDLQSVVRHWFVEHSRDLYRERSGFEAVNWFESVRRNGGAPDNPPFDDELARLHVREARSLGAGGYAAVLALVHVARARQLTDDIPERVFRRITHTANAAITSQAKLQGELAIEANVNVDPVDYALPLAWLAREIRRRTRNHFEWEFASTVGISHPSRIVIERARFLPRGLNLRTVASEYYSHDEQTPNPAKSYWEMRLQSARWDLNAAAREYESAVASYNIYPTDFGLARANRAYTQYRRALDTYNSLVDRYNATPSYVTRPVYLPYAYEEGNVEFGWHVQLGVYDRDTHRVIEASSIERDHVRFGTRYNDKHRDRRRDDPLAFEISLERSINHLNRVVSELADQLAGFIGKQVTILHRANLSSPQVDLVGWLLHPWGPEYAPQNESVVPTWVGLVIEGFDVPSMKTPPPNITLPVPTAAVSGPYGVESIAREAGKNIVLIETETRHGGISSTSGAIISPDGLVLTCAHGLEGDLLRVTVLEGPHKGRYHADFVFVNKTADVAILRARDLETDRWLPIRMDTPVDKGERIVAMGNPSLAPKESAQGAVTVGVVAAAESTGIDVPRLVADITVASGSSGGPLISLEDGRVVGVVTHVAPAGLAMSVEGRSASGMFCLAAPAVRFAEWLGLSYTNRGELDSPGAR